MATLIPNNNLYDWTMEYVTTTIPSQVACRYSIYASNSLASLNTVKWSESINQIFWSDEIPDDKKIYRFSLDEGATL